MSSRGGSGGSRTDWLAVMRDLLHGNEQAGSVAAHQLSRKILWHLMKYGVWDPDDRADIVQIVIEKLIKTFAAGSPCPSDKFEGYLKTTVRNAVSDYYRSRGIEISMDDPPDPVDDNLEDAEGIVDLNDCLPELSEAEKKVVDARFWRDLTWDETARKADISRGHVTRVLRSAEQKLRECLERKKRR